MSARSFERGQPTATRFLAICEQNQYANSSGPSPTLGVLWVSVSVYPIIIIIIINPHGRFVKRVPGNYFKLIFYDRVLYASHGSAVDRGPQRVIKICSLRILLTAVAVAVVVGCNTTGVRTYLRIHTRYYIGLFFYYCIIVIKNQYPRIRAQCRHVIF